MVDNEAAAQNLKRMGEQQGCEVKLEERTDGLYVLLKRLAGKTGDSCGVFGLPAVLAISLDCMGRGEERLGKLLMRSFLHTLRELPQVPQKAIFFNRGIKLVVEGSEALDDLKALEERGVEILACGTCLDYFGLKERIRVGKVSNMYEITEALLSASKLIAL